MKTLQDLLFQLGLAEEEVDVFVFLLQQGPSTILDISRAAGINRTALYRLCEGLTEKGYLKKLAERNTTRYEASSIEFLQTKVDEHRANSLALQKQYGFVEEAYKKLVKLEDNEIKVIHYTGSEEIKQLIWNTLNSHDVNVGFGYRTMSEAVGSKFIVRWWNECVRRKKRQKVLANPGTFAMKNSVDAATKEKYADEMFSVMEEREIDPEIFRINQETFIYNDIYAIVQWKDNFIFGVEVYNQAVADQQREIFKVLWKMGEPVFNN